MGPGTARATRFTTKSVARKVAELGLGDVVPLDEAIPEPTIEGGSVGGNELAFEEPETGSAFTSSRWP